MAVWEELSVTGEFPNGGLEAFARYSKSRAIMSAIIVCTEYASKTKDCVTCVIHVLYKFI